MFHAQASAHQFSPQRRQVLGGRLSPKKGHAPAMLGSEEAGQVGPQKLFADLKQTTSAKKASSSKSTLGSTMGNGNARVFGEKVNQSPQRASERRDAGDIPIKPQKRMGASRPSQLISPSKVSKTLDRSLFPGSVSPAKRGKSQQGTPAPVEGDTHIAPTKPIVSEQMAISEEELYPEIEYMPPKVEVPYDFGPEFDGLPSGAELGQMFRSVRYAGFYKPSRPESIELQREELLADIPDRIDTETLDDLRISPIPDTHGQMSQHRHAPMASFGAVKGNDMKLSQHSNAKVSTNGSNQRRLPFAQTSARSASASTSRTMPRNAIVGQASSTKEGARPLGSSARPFKATRPLNMR